MSGEEGAAPELEELEIDGIVLRAEIAAQCTECESLLTGVYEFDADRDEPGEIGSLDIVCPTCTARNGVKSVLCVAVPAGTVLDALLDTDGEDLDDGGPLLPDDGPEA